MPWAAMLSASCPVASKGHMHSCWLAMAIRHNRTSRYDRESAREPPIPRLVPNNLRSDRQNGLWEACRHIAEQAIFKSCDHATFVIYAGVMASRLHHFIYYARLCTERRSHLADQMSSSRLAGPYLSALAGLNCIPTLLAPCERD